MNRDEGVLVDILFAARDILSFKAGLDRESFRSDAKTQAAIIYKLTIIGEAARRLSPSFREADEAIPWARVTGMRNRLIHEYERTDLDEVWRVVEQEIPHLIAHIESIVTPPPA